MPAGRPSDYSEEIALEICTRLAEGEPLCRICKDEHMPVIGSVYRWRRAHPEFRDYYDSARADQVDTLVSEIVDISDTPQLGLKTVVKANGDKETTEGDMIEHRRLRVDTRKWYASHVMPRKYSDRMALTGADGETLPQPIVNVYLPKNDRD